MVMQFRLEIECDNSTQHELRELIPQESNARFVERLNLDGDAATWIVIATLTGQALPHVLSFLTNQQKAGVKRIKVGDLEIENPTKEDVEQLYRRLLQQYEPDETIKAVPSMLRILFLAANPNQTSRLDLEEEIRSVEMELQAVKHREAISMIPCHAVRPDDFVRYVRDLAPNVIHFSGHGSPDGIVLRNDVGGYQTVSGDALRRFFANRGIELVILNACVSGDQAKQISTVVPAVVGTSELVGDEAARRFSVTFYRGLGNGLKISEAFRDGGDSVALHGLSDVFVNYGNLEIALVGAN